MNGTHPPRVGLHMWKAITCQLRIQRRGLRHRINALDGENKGAECLINTKELIQCKLLLDQWPILAFSTRGSGRGQKFTSLVVTVYILKHQIFHQNHYWVLSLQLLLLDITCVKFKKHANLIYFYSSWGHMRDNRVIIWGKRGQFCSRPDNILCLLLSYWSWPLSPPACNEQTGKIEGSPSNMHNQSVQQSARDQAKEVKHNLWLATLLESAVVISPIN